MGIKNDNDAKIQAGVDSANLNLHETEIKESEINDFATQKATSERGDVDIIALKVRTNDERIYPGMRFKLLR